MIEIPENLQPEEETTFPFLLLAMKCSPFLTCDFSETVMPSPPYFPMTELTCYSSALLVGENVRKTPGLLSHPQKGRTVCVHTEKFHTSTWVQK